MAIEDVTNYPVLRPVLSFDKTEIIKIAEDIDTYDLSILPYEDCCTVFTPPSPKTKPSVKKARLYAGLIIKQQLLIRRHLRQNNLLVLVLRYGDTAQLPVQPGAEFVH